MESWDVNNWEEAKRSAAQYRQGWVFRGQTDDWPLLTTLNRRYPRTETSSEGALQQRFVRSVPSLLQPHLVPADNFGWSGLIQHYGGPTRLLDCTNSYYVALFFALEGAETDHEPVLYAFHCGQMVEHASARYAAMTGGTIENARALMHYGQNQMFDFLRANDPFLGVVPMSPWLPDHRQSAQQAAFLCAADAGASFQENIDAVEVQRPSSYCKMRIDRCIRVEALEDLRRMNISAATLFPGLDGVARSLNTWLLVDE